MTTDTDRPLSYGEQIAVLHGAGRYDDLRGLAETLAEDLERAQDLLDSKAGLRGCAHCHEIAEPGEHMETVLVPGYVHPGECRRALMRGE